MNSRKKYRIWGGWVLLFAGALAAAQDFVTGPLGTVRMRAIALQAEPPGPLSTPYVELLNTVAEAIVHSTQQVAADRFERFLVRQRDAGRKAVPAGYLDYVLRRAATLENTGAAAASERVAYFNAQENAVLEHLSFLEKHYSDRAGSRLPDFVIREPVLGEFGQDDKPVRQGLPQTANTDELPQRIAQWRRTLDGVTAQRTAAVRAFDEAVRTDSALLNKLTEADYRLTRVVREVFATAAP